MGRVLVVGADRGIAHALCLQLSARGDEVTAACLGSGEDLAREKIRVEPRIDVTSDEDVARLAVALKARLDRLDWLLHVAGVLGLDELG